VATALKFPRHFSPNLDALNDCLTDLTFKSGVHSITLVKLSKSATGEAIYAVFKSAARQWKKQGATVALNRE
jgi:RNAse (barnase) inhibitor barstar